jgi:DNA polymerase V
MKTIFALVDCNNFFVSCERLFRPDLEGKPVVVLSSNDGCVVARSNEAKALDIPMGAPAFKYRQLFKDKGVVQFSANFDLYGDISKRITSLLTTVTPRIEIYSVDESFLDLSQLPITDYEAWGRQVREAILRWVGVPVSIGIAPSKTLAKLASDRAKKAPELQGALSLMNTDSKACKQHLESVPIKDVWGVGRRLGPKLRAEGVGNAWSLRNLRPQRAQQLMGIHGRQMVSELQGVSCYSLTLEDRLPKTIAATRTFGEDTDDQYAIEAALTSFATKAAFKLRVSYQLARHVSLFLTTSRHKPGYRTWGQEITFQTPTADTGHIISAVIQAFRQLYRPGMQYHRAGVNLYDFKPLQLQTDLLGSVDQAEHDRSQARMAAVDGLNARYGKHHVYYAAEDLGKAWQPRQHLRSPRYVSHWEELPGVKIHHR